MLIYLHGAEYIYYFRAMDGIITVETKMMATTTGQLHLEVIVAFKLYDIDHPAYHDTTAKFDY